MKTKTKQVILLIAVLMLFFLAAGLLIGSLIRSSHADAALKKETARYDGMNRENDCEALLETAALYEDRLKTIEKKVEDAEKALSGDQNTIAANAAEIEAIASEIKTILDQYGVGEIYEEFRDLSARYEELAARYRALNEEAGT